MSKQENPGRLTLLKVRLAGHSLYTPSAMEANQDPKFSASFIFDKGSDNAKAAKAAIEEVAKTKFGKTYLSELKALVAGDKLCLHDGVLKADKDGYGEGVHFLNANSKTRPGLFDRAKAPVTEADGVIYSGCYVNVIVDLWAQDNQWGKRINAEVKGVQFVADGDRLGGATPANAEDFPDLDDEAEPGGDFAETTDDDDWDA